MKPSIKLLLIMPLLLMVAVLNMRCGSDSSAVIPTNQHRFQLFTARDGFLSLTAADVELSNDLSMDASNGLFTLTLENLSNPMIIYGEGRQQKAMVIDFTALLNLWGTVYGHIPPHATLHARLSSSGVNEELYLALSDPVYEAASNRITFKARVLDSTLDSMDAGGITYFNNIKVTILDHNRFDNLITWTLALGAREGQWVSTGQLGVYKLYLNFTFDDLYALSDAPDNFIHRIPEDLFADSWRTRFGDVPPTASLTSYDVSGQARVQTMTLSDPEIIVTTGAPRTVQLVFTANLLQGLVYANQALLLPTLFIDAPATDKCDTGFTKRMIIFNNCDDDAWMFQVPPGLLPEQWAFWENYGTKRYLNPSVPAAGYWIETKITRGDTQYFCIPDKGAPSGKFNFYLGCDDKKDNDTEWGDCIIGSAPGHDLMSVNTVFEPTYGCKYYKKDADNSACATNTAASPYKPLDQADWFDIGAVDGFTLPMLLEVTNPDGLKCTRTSTDGSMLDLASCPTETNATLYSTDVDQQNKINSGISLVNISSGGYQACSSPCKWFSNTQLGTPGNPTLQTQAETAPPVNASCYYCCGNNCFEAEGDPACVCPGCGGWQCVQGPDDGGTTYPVPMTAFVRRLKEMGYKGYTWAYDDNTGLTNCANWGAVLKVTLCPGGGKPYDLNRKWKYASGACTPDDSGAYASLYECQTANLKYSCATETFTDPNNSANTLTYYYCQVDPSGTQTYAQCSAACK